MISGGGECTCWSRECSYCREDREEREREEEEERKRKEEKKKKEEKEKKAKSKRRRKRRETKKMKKSRRKSRRRKNRKTKRKVGGSGKAATPEEISNLVGVRQSSDEPRCYGCRRRCGAAARGATVTADEWASYLCSLCVKGCLMCDKNCCPLCCPSHNHSGYPAPDMERCGTPPKLQGRV